MLADQVYRVIGKGYQNSLYRLPVTTAAQQPLCALSALLADALFFPFTGMTPCRYFPQRAQTALTFIRPLIYDTDIHTRTGNTAVIAAQRTLQMGQRVISQPLLSPCFCLLSVHAVRAVQPSPSLLCLTHFC